MVKTNKKSIGLLGGSFDPAHKGHLIISKIALKKMRLNKVLWLITEKNPFKNKSFYSLTQRIKKAKKIVKQEKKIKVKSLDKIVGSSRSINIINYLINEKKLTNIYFIIGADNLIKFHKWKNWKKIVKLTKLIVFSRRGYDKKGKKSIVSKYLENKIIFVDNKHISISSSKLRKQSKKNINGNS
jgi:nicotinate-nucleotide adenylyltransferase